MKTLKFLLMFAFVLGLSMNNGNAQGKTVTEKWEYFLWTDCLPEISGTLIMEVKYVTDKSIVCKGGGILYDSEDNPYEVKLINNGWFIWSDDKGMEWSFVEVYKIYKDSKLVCTAQRTSNARSDVDGNFQFYKGHEIYNCK